MCVQVCDGAGGPAGVREVEGSPAVYGARGRDSGAVRAVEGSRVMGEPGGAAHGRLVVHSTLKKCDGGPAVFVLIYINLN